MITICWCSLDIHNSRKASQAPDMHHKSRRLNCIDFFSRRDVRTLRLRKNLLEPRGPMFLSSHSPNSIIERIRKSERIFLRWTNVHWCEDLRNFVEICNFFSFSCSWVVSHDNMSLTIKKFECWLDIVGLILKILRLRAFVWLFFCFFHLNLQSCVSQIALFS